MFNMAGLRLADLMHGKYNSFDQAALSFSGSFSSFHPQGSNSNSMAAVIGWSRSHTVTVS